MTNIPDQIKIPKEFDGRRKLTDEHRRKIRDLYYVENWAIRRIARNFENVVTRRMIQFTIFPERYEEAKARRREKKVHLKYYDRGKHSKAIKALREKKRRIFNLKTYSHPSDYTKESPEEKKRINKLINK